jgi:hypothetical protein
MSMAWDIIRMDGGRIVGSYWMASKEEGQKRNTWIKVAG